MTLNDAILAATGGPTVNDGLLAYYKAGGATGVTLSDCELQWLKIKLPAAQGTIQDLWGQYLKGTLGHQGSLNDMLYQYWVEATVGARPFIPTPAALGTRYASPTGSGTAYTFANPGPINGAIAGCVPGDVLFLRGGVYSTLAGNVRAKVNGTAQRPIIIESYPGEVAIFEGNKSGVVLDDAQRVVIEGSFIRLRNVEVRNTISYAGVWVGSQGSPGFNGSDNLIENVRSYDNVGSGFQNYGDRNTYLSCIATDNSGAGYSDPAFANGEHSDGFSVSDGDRVSILNCEAYGSSDDAFDLWGATNSYIGYSIGATSGIAAGDGNGFKAGGNGSAINNTIEHCLSYQNVANGFDFNSTFGVKFLNNTAWNNGGVGYQLGNDVDVVNNIAKDNVTGAVSGPTTGANINNSWQRGGTVQFKSTSPGANGFLVPTLGGGFEDIGAYGAS